jgi:hypothetical protein
MLSSETFPLLQTIGVLRQFPLQGSRIKAHHPLSSKSYPNENCFYIVILNLSFFNTLMTSKISLAKTSFLKKKRQMYFAVFFRKSCRLLEKRDFCSSANEEGAIWLGRKWCLLKW